ncbi:CD99 antigen [Pelodiscus sinensis]|uniref:CD99 molecule (Xg blood group) n=1 Tax=Pelodiscus sinensis TaxID=13735 RepID=K7F472_PELSI|nr:CD99 antigen [Pelodiscus sinensis]|eukprot:XP_006112319.1 CD99 antigen [Pelodiscus sinensis]
MQRGRLTLLLSLAFLLLHVRGQGDFDLSDAFDTEPTNRPDSVTKNADSDDRKPQPGSKDNTGGSFKDEDLIDGENTPPKKRGGDPKPTSAGDTEASQGLIPGVISAVLVTVVGAVSSFIAYQKKKLCFKASGNEETVNMESQQGAHAEPPVQQTLLQK